MFSKDALKGQRILVTGGGSGLGKEMSRHFLKHGSEVVICGRRGDYLNEKAKIITEKTGNEVIPVSYTHLTLPTNREV